MNNLIDSFVAEITRALDVIFSDPANVVDFLEQKFDVSLSNRYVVKIKYKDLDAIKMLLDSRTPMPFTVITRSCPLKVFFSQRASLFLPPDQQKIVVIRPSQLLSP